MRLTQLRLFTVTMLLAVTPALRAATWYVNGQTGKDSNNCNSAATACRTIGLAISMASSGDSILVAAATYAENLTVTSNLTITGSSALNTIVDGGGVARVITITNSDAHVNLSNFTIRGGIAAGGGGILNWGTLNLSYVTVTQNAAVSSYSATGAGINNSGTLTVNNSTISGNGGSTNFMYGGGIYNSGTVVINNSTLSGNTAGGFNGGGGGAIYNDSVVKIASSTIAGNSGSPNGGGIYNNGTATLKNTILATGSAGGNCYGTVTSSGYNLSSDGTCLLSSSGDSNSTNPLLAPLRYNGGTTFTMALQNGSPAVDAGNPDGCTDDQGSVLTIDQRGWPRPGKKDNGGCDIGAFEKQRN